MAGSTWNVFVAATKAQAGQVNENFDWLEGDLWPQSGGVTAHNTYDLGDSTSLAWRNGYIGTEIYIGTTLQVKAALQGYRRPVLQWVSATTIDAENNTGTANQTTVVFPDGEVRSVTEDTAATNKYRRFIITSTAEFSAGTEDSGLRSGLAEANNTWYAIYAVKSTIDATKFVLAGDTTMPNQANFSTLNTRYGTNGWQYLGMIRNGDNDGAVGDILVFKMVGNTTVLRNNLTGGLRGILENSGSTTGTLAFAFSTGVGTSGIPDNLAIGKWGFSLTAGTSVTSFYIRSGDSSWTYIQSAMANTTTLGYVQETTGDGLAVSHNTGATTTKSISFSGFIDSVLGVGFNPVI